MEADSAIQQPTLILWGQLDDWIPLAMGRKFDVDLPHSKLVIYPDAGHVAMEEIPAESAGDVRRWVDEGSRVESALARMPFQFPNEIPRTMKNSRDADAVRQTA